MLPLFVMLAAVGNARFLSEAIDPTLGKESAVDGRRWARGRQHAAAIRLLPGRDRRLCRSACRSSWISYVPAVAITFVICRIVFWIGYRIHPLYRAPGFASTAYMNLFMYIAVIWLRLA